MAASNGQEHWAYQQNTTNHQQYVPRGVMSPAGAGLPTPQGFSTVQPPPPQDQIQNQGPIQNQSQNQGQNQSQSQIQSQNRSPQSKVPVASS